MLANLHSLINRPWYIDQGYAMAQMPLLMSLISGNEIQPSTKKPLVNTRSFSASQNGAQKDVAIISLKDPIYKYDQECGPDGTQTRMELMKSFENNPNIAGVVLDIDSGGGQVSGTPEFFDFIQSYSKPVVSYTGGYMCSAAYYIGSAADHVIANPRAEAIGSIGAYIQLLDLSGYYEAQGAKLHTVYASQSSEKNKAYREALEGNYDALVNEELDPIVDDFIADMKSAMPNLDKKVFKGATYAGPMAAELNLVDQLGSLDDAVNKVLELSNSNSNKNSKTMNTTERPNLQAVLELDAPLASNDNGTYLNDEQLDVIDGRFAENATALSTAQAAQQNAEDALTQEQQVIADTDTALNSLAALAGVEVSENRADTFTALEAKITELKQKPGDTHTTIKKKQDEESAHQYIDFNSPLYQN